MGHQKSRLPGGRLLGGTKLYLFLIEAHSGRIEKSKDEERVVLQPLVGQNRIGRSDLQRADLRAAERQRRERLKRADDADRLRGEDDILDPDLLGEADRRGVQRALQRRPQCDRAVVILVIVLRRPFLAPGLKGQRSVYYPADRGVRLLARRRLFKGGK